MIILELIFFHCKTEKNIQGKHIQTIPWNKKQQISTDL